MVSGKTLSATDLKNTKQNNQQIKTEASKSKEIASNKNIKTSKVQTIYYTVKEGDTPLGNS